MSSSDVLDASDRKGCGSVGFEPLGTSEGSVESVDQEWRPLFEEMASDGVGEFYGRLGADGGEGPQGGGESGACADGDGDSSEASARTFEAGYELGRQETEADIQGVAETLIRSVEELAAFRARLRERYQRELLELALAVARKILHAEVKKNPETWLRLIREGISNAVDREEVHIRVPGPLATFLTDHLPEMRKRLDDVKELIIVEDPALSEGGCVIETRFGELDVGVDAQVDQVQRQLTRMG